MKKQTLLIVAALIASINTFAENQVHISTHLYFFAGVEDQRFINEKPNLLPELADNPERRGAESGKKADSSRQRQKLGEGSSTGCNGGSRSNDPATAKIGRSTRTGFQGKNKRANIRSSTRINRGLQSF